MSYEEFLNSTPRIIRSLNDLEVRWQENLLIGTYIKIHSESNKKEKPVKIDSFRDL